MSKVLLIIFTIVFGQLVNAQESQEQQGNLIRLVAALDEPEFYCIDLVGWGDSLELDSPLQAHTCKTRTAADQSFAFNDDQVSVTAHDRCLQVAGTSGVTLSGSALLARDCSESPLQKLSLNEQGQLQLMGTKYCIVAGTESTDASGPSHLWRSLSTAKCASADAELSNWQVGLE